MPYADKEKRKQYANGRRRAARLDRGLQKSGRKPLTEEQKKVSLLKRKEYEKQWNIEHPYSSEKKENRLLWAAKKRSKEEKVPFDITVEDILIPERCPYLGILLVNTRPRGELRNDVASLDKIIPSLGYTKGNIEVMSQQANTMKSNATKEQLVLFAKEILKRYG